MMADPKRPGLTCEAPEDAYPRDTYFVGQGVPPPPTGWRREVVPRKTVAGADAYYYSPCGKRMRSKPDVQRFLDKVWRRGGVGLCGFVGRLKGTLSTLVVQS